MTDGLLLAELASDPLLRRYDTVIVDEAHGAPSMSICCWGCSSGSCRAGRS